MESLTSLSNSELAAKMFDLTRRYGELSLWMADCELKIYNMITKNEQVQSIIAYELDLKQSAEIEKFVVLSDLKKIELEMDRRVCGAV